MEYYTTEKSDQNAIRTWELCNAKTLAAAKRIATKRQCFLGTIVAVAVKHDADDNGYEQVAYKREGSWVDVICVG